MGPEGQRKEKEEEALAEEEKAEEVQFLLFLFFVSLSTFKHCVLYCPSSSAMYIETPATNRVYPSPLSPRRSGQVFPRLAP